MRALAGAVLLLAALAAGCDEEQGAPGAAGSGGGAAGSGGEGGAAGSGGSGGDGAAARTIFLDWCAGGCTVTPAATDDARTDASTLVDSVSAISESAIPAATRTEVLTCLRGLFADFDVAVVDVDPGPGVLHREVMVGTVPSQVGLPSGVTGVAPFTCENIEAAIAFVFADPIGDDARLLCETMAQQLGATVGLDVAYHCPDVMSYLTGCGEKTFTDVDASCGESMARACACGRASQNSSRLLLERLGAAR